MSHINCCCIFFLSLIEGVCEVCVATAEDACDLYETGRKTLRTRARDVCGRWFKGTEQTTTSLQLHRTVVLLPYE